MIQQHGGNIFGYDNIIDFSANINPLGTPESVKNAIAESIASIEKYPDPYCTELREKLAMHENVRTENIVCGNGADDLIFRIVHAFKPKKALICAPSFTEYSRALSEVDCAVHEHLLTENSSFDVNENLVQALDRSFDMCFVCTPNNPTGRLIAPDILRNIAEKCLVTNTILVCDECFLEFAENGKNHSLANFINEKCIILKAFTKLYAMPGIRLGYAVCGSLSAAEIIQDSGQFWSISALAQTAGIAALRETSYVRKTAEFVTSGRFFLTEGLTSLGIKVFPSDANFLLFKGISELCEKMLAEGIFIRDCSNFSGLTDGFYRIAVRNHNENIRLIEALGRCMNG